MKMVFKNFATKLRIKREQGLFVFYDGNYLVETYTKNKTYEKCLKNLQIYSKKYYGEKAI